MREKMLPSHTVPDFQQYLLSRKLVPGKSGWNWRRRNESDIRPFRPGPGHGKHSEGTPCEALFA
jgi:hypothetical protein